MLTNDFSTGHQKIPPRTESAGQSGQNRDSGAAEEVGHSSPVRTSPSRLPDRAANVQNRASGQEMKKVTNAKRVSIHNSYITSSSSFSPTFFYQIYQRFFCRIFQLKVAGQNELFFVIFHTYTIKLLKQFEISCCNTQLVRHDICIFFLLLFFYCCFNINV